MMSKDILRGVVDVAIDENCLWVLTDTLNCIFRYDFSKQELELAAVFPESMSMAFEPFSRIVKMEDEIYFIPRFAKDVFYYSLKEAVFHQLDVNFDSFLNDKNIGVVTFEKYIYCINRFPDAVIKIDTETKEVNIFYADMNLHIDRNIESKIYRVYKAPCVYDGKIIWSNYRDMLTIFDMETERFFVEYFERPSRNCIERVKNIWRESIEDWIVGVRVFENKLWLFSFEGEVYQYYEQGLYKIESTLFESYVHYEDADKIRCCILYDIVALKDELWFIPGYKNKCIKYSGKTSLFNEAMGDYVQNWDGNRRSYTGCCVIGYSILLYSYYEHCFYVLDTKNDVVYKRKMEIPYAKFLENNRLFGSMVVKDNTYLFDDLDYLFDKLLLNDNAGQRIMQDGLNGERIYKTIK